MPVWMQIAIWFCLGLWTWHELRITERIIRSNGRVWRNKYGQIKAMLWVVLTVFWICWNIWG